MALQGPADWRGRPVNKKRHGGVKASMFIHFLVVMANITNLPMIFNLVSYLLGTMHMDVKEASTTSTNFFGAFCFFSILGAFISDSYIKRFYTILIFAPLEIMGYVLLACQAHFPSLHPPPCDMINNPSECTPVSGRNKSLLTLGLYLIPIGESSMRACAAALGGDQFDDDDPAELHSKVSFFNWFAFDLSLGGFVGLVFLVWLQDNKGWSLGFTVASVMLLVGVLVVVVGSPFYRHRKPTGSPVTRILQVFVAAFRKRRLPLPENVMEMHDVMDDGTGMESIERTAGFRFLEKAAVDDGGDRGPWSLCTVTQVEEAKIIIRMIPIFLSSILAYIPLSLLLALTVQQGAIMDTSLGGISIPPGSLFIVAVAFQMLFLVVYDRAVLPCLRRATGYAGGVRHLQRVGVGFVSSAVALATAAVVEGYRRRRALAGDPPSSAFLLTPQFFAIGVMDVTSFVGLLEFFSSEASPGMKSIGSSILFCILGIGSWLGSLLIHVVNRATKHRSGGHGWLDGASLNASRLDLFYWLLALLGLIAFFLYMVCAWTYTYRHDPRMQTTMDDEKVSTPASRKQSPVEAKVSTPVSNCQ